MQLTHLHTYKQRVEQIYHTHFKRAWGRPKADIRQTALLIAYTFNGYKQAYIAHSFGVSITAVTYALAINKGREPGRLYNELLEIYIDSCREYLKS